jgi:hypothetical protein
VHISVKNTIDQTTTLHWHGMKLPAKADGSITAWGDPDSGGAGAPSGAGYTKIYSTGFAFAALKADGSITSWGSPGTRGVAPSDSGYSFKSGKGTTS